MLKRRYLEKWKSLDEINQLFSYFLHIIMPLPCLWLFFHSPSRLKKYCLSHYHNRFSQQKYHKWDYPQRRFVFQQFYFLLTISHYIHHRFHTSILHHHQLNHPWIILHRSTPSTKVYPNHFFSLIPYFFSKILMRKQKILKISQLIFLILPISFILRSICITHGTIALELFVSKWSFIDVSRLLLECSFDFLSISSKITNVLITRNK